MLEQYLNYKYFLFFTFSVSKIKTTKYNNNMLILVEWSCFSSRYPGWMWVASGVSGHNPGWMWAESEVSGHYPGWKWAESGVNLGTILGECGLDLGYLGNILGGCGLNLGYLGTILGGCGENVG